MLIPVLAGCGALVLLFLLIVALRSNEFLVSRSVTLKTAPDRVFEQVNDLHLMNTWNPWVKLDPQIKQTYSGAASGVGAVYDWDGNKNVGAGRQTIIESRASELVRMKLEFFRPFAGTNEAWFQIDRAGDHTTLSWNLAGKMNFFMKGMSLFCSMDRMCGGMMEQGLASLKKNLEV